MEQKDAILRDGIAVSVAAIWIGAAAVLAAALTAAVVFRRRSVAAGGRRCAAQRRLVNQLDGNFLGAAVSIDGQLHRVTDFQLVLDLVDVGHAGNVLAVDTGDNIARLNTLLVCIG